MLVFGFYFGGTPRDYFIQKILKMRKMQTSSTSSTSDITGNLEIFAQTEIIGKHAIKLKIHTTPIDIKQAAVRE